MKQIILTLALVMASLSGMAQTARPQTAKALMQEFRHDKNAYYIHIGGLLTTLARPFIDMGDDDHYNIKGAKSLRVLTLDDCPKRQMRKLDHALKRLKDNNYEEIVRTNDDDEEVRIFALPRGKAIREVLIVSKDDDECTLVQLNGKFRTKDLLKMSR